MTGQEASRRVTVQEAADELGISVDAVRKRVERGAIRSDKEGTRVYVWLDSVMDSDRTKRQVESDAIVEELRDQVAFLRDQLREERESRKRADTIIASLSNATAEQARTIRELEEANGDAERVQEPSSASPTTSDTPTPDTNAQTAEEQRVSWWKRVFGG